MVVCTKIELSPEVKPMGKAIKKTIEDMGKEVLITIDCETRICIFIKPALTPQEKNTLKDLLPDDFKHAWKLRYKEQELNI